MPGDAHVFITHSLLIFYTNPWPRIMDSAIEGICVIYTGCDLQIAVFLLLSLFWTNINATTKTPPHNATIFTTHDTPNAILHDHAMTLSALERV